MQLLYVRIIVPSPCSPETWRYCHHQEASECYVSADLVPISNIPQTALHMFSRVSGITKHQRSEETEMAWVQKLTALLRK